MGNTARVRFFVGLVGLVFLMGWVGCVSSQGLKSVIDADENMVAGCKYLGTVTGTSGWGGAASSAGLENARRTAATEGGRSSVLHISYG